MVVLAGMAWGIRVTGVRRRSRGAAAQPGPVSPPRLSGDPTTAQGRLCVSWLAAS